MTDLVGVLVERVRKTENGFGDIKLAAQEVTSSNTLDYSIAITKELFSSETHQARMLATFILGMVASQSEECLRFLRGQVSKDANWRVQEILAQAFDNYCADTGYEKALPTIQDWLRDSNPNVRRAATEGLRIWTSRPYFKTNPEVAIQMLSALKGDESEYVRKSVGNALRDISRKHAKLVENELDTWNVADKRVLQVYKLAGKFIVTSDE